MSKEVRELLAFGIVGLLILLVAGALIGSCSYYGPQYKVWQQHMEGEAELAKAQANRNIRTLEAKAKMDSAKFDAEAEIIRAKGVAQANHIIGQSLKGNEDYLHYLWITDLSKSSNEKIYIPTEANLPILEARQR